MNNDCLFCRISSKEIPSKVVYEDDEIMAFEDINSQAPLHVLLIPKKHVETLNDFEEKDAVLIGKMFLKAKKIAKDKGVSDGGYRVVVNCNKDAGQEVFHMHMHLLGGRKFTWPPG